MSTPVRRTIRLPGFDYTRPGAYFVTICAFNKACLFGNIVDGVMRFNGYGEIVQRSWDDLPNHFPHVELDQFVIMPNHVHGIIVLNDDVDVVGVAHASPAILTDVGVGAGFKPAWNVDPTIMHKKPQNRAGLKPAPTPVGKRHGLPEIVRAFKTFSARRINALRHTPSQPVWQRNYYEHVIRNDADLAAIRDYIAGNPARWLDDDNHPGRATAQGRNHQNPLGLSPFLR
jgi:REP element-mobilizing transposase RayT